MNKCEHLTGRPWVEQGYLPQLEGRVLWVGVAEYTYGYWDRVKDPELFETIDIMPDRAAFGSPAHHYIGDFREFETIREYDHIGVYGMSPRQTPKTESWILWSHGLLNKADHLLKVGGTILWGGTVREGWKELIRTWDRYSKYRELHRLEMMYGKVKNVKIWLRKKKES